MSTTTLSQLYCDVTKSIPSSLINNDDVDVKSSDTYEQNYPTIRRYNI